ncbi:BnaC07g18480D [Brassica napus]|uniref:BnaC07g18480D protein n=1 Tax=Brassica napus TaxID=3708 RepID=A0A078HM42_BRANA|nr:BnaC07g18480D [Brassica napus]
MAQKCTIDQIKDVLSDLQSQLDAIKESKKDTVLDLQSELDAPTQSEKDNVVDKNEEPVDKPVEEKRTQSSSWWGRIRETVKKGFRVKKESSAYASDNGEGSQGQDQEEANLEILKLQNDIRQMKAAFEKLAHFQSNISKSLEIEVPSNKLRAILLKTDSAKSRARDLKEIRRKVLNLKGQIPSLLKKQSSIGLSVTDSQTSEENGQIVETGSDILLPGLHVSDDFKHSSAFEEVVETFEVLEFTYMLCLLSFAVFPENKEVKKTMLMYWWIGEGFISYEDSENTVTRILDELSRKGLVEPAEDERKLKTGGYKMDPHVHAAVVYLASRNGLGLFDLYSERKLKMQCSESHNVCLVKRSSLQPEAKASKMPLKDMNSIFNSSERYPDFTFKWFPEMDSLKVLYLGRWERTAKRHIEVESTEFLKDIKSLKNLRLASFQGISRIENLKKLPCSLPRLVILDLRACYNLEGLPEDIGSLESLIYLDVSECYMLDRMPREISRLKTLQVLKGFVISQSDNEKECAVKHLANLRKLSITVNRYQFKVEDFMESLKDLKQLESLKIAWGARFRYEEEWGKGGQLEETDEAKGSTETANEENPPKEGNDEKKGQTNEESLKADKVVDGDEGNAAQEEGKKQDKVDAEKSRSEDGVIKASPSSESTNKSDTVNPEEGMKRDEVSSKPDMVTEGDEKDTVKSKPDDHQSGDKPEEKRDGEEDKTEGEKKDEVKADVSEVDKKTSTPQEESKDTIQSNPDDHQRGEKQEEKRDGEEDKTEGEKKDEVKPEISEVDKKTNKVDEKTSPPQESKDTMIQSKPDDHQRGEKQEEKRDIIEKANTKGEVTAENSKPDKVDEKTSPPQESKDTMIQSKPDDHQRGEKQEEKRDIIEKANTKGEVTAENSKPDKVDEKTSPPQESKDTMIQSKPDDHQRGEKQEEKRDIIEKANTKGEVTAENSKPDKVDEKTSPAQESKDTMIQSKPDDHQRAPVQKKQAIKESGSRKSKLFNMTRTETKKHGKGRQEDSGIGTSKLPSSLRKLELECYPEKNPPVWLNPKTLDKLEKLSIKGGSLSRFSDKPSNAENKCSVQILRLKYLHEFKAEWKDLQGLFPQLKLLEKFKCPEVAFCPTDGNGVWRSQP